MSRLAKILRNPRRFFRDAATKQHLARQWRAQERERGPDAPTALLVGFARWKTFIFDYLPGYRIVLLSTGAELSSATMRSILDYPRPHVFTWSYRFPPELEAFCRLHEVPLTFVEDGFIRSVGLGADRTSPMSLVFDHLAMHFDRSRPSQLENLLQTYDFAGDAPLMARAEALAGRMLHEGLTKYQLPARRRVTEVLQPARPRILVLGQVEDDLSIRYGAEKLFTGNELVQAAQAENPTAQILYRPHPESLAFRKPHYSRPEDVAHLATILGTEFGIGDCLDHADKVYTVTSLAGFEAALRGKTVVTLGAPFYSGWGFTEDRIVVPRRTRRLTTLEVLAGAYLIYPRTCNLAQCAGPNVDG